MRRGRLDVDDAEADPRSGKASRMMAETPLRG
jgi:hypothetical protein